MPQEPFSADDVIKVCERLKNQQDFRAWETTNHWRDARRYLRIGVSIPGIPELLEDRRSDIEHQIERFDNYIDGADFSVSVAARDKSQAAVEAAQKMENAFYYIISEFASQRTNMTYAADRRAIDQQVSKGAGIRRLDFAPKIRKALFGQQITDAADLAKILASVEEEFKRNPFVIECPDLEATFWNQDHSVFAEVGEKEVTALSELSGSAEEYIQKYKGGFTSETMKEHEKSEHVIKTYHLETESFIYDVIDASDGTEPHMMEHRPNIAGRPWYTITPGNLTSSRHVGEAYQPLVASVYVLCERLAILGTLLNSSALQTGRIGYQLVRVGSVPNIGYMELFDPEFDMKQVEFDLTSDKMQNPPDGFEYKPIPVPDQSTLRDVYNDTKLELEQKGYPPILDPSAVLKAESGYDRNQQMEAATMYMEPPLRNRASSTRELMILIATVARQLPVTIELPVLDRAKGRDMKVVSRVSLVQDDWRDADISIGYKSTPLGAQSVMEEMHSRRMQLGLESRQTFMGVLHDDPLDEQGRIDQDAMRDIAKKRAFTDIETWLDTLATPVFEQELAEQGIPLTPVEIQETLQGQVSGPRDRRPAGFSVPGTGSPTQPPAQTPESAGTEVMA